MTIAEIEAAVEAVLFAAGDEVTLNAIAQAVNLDTKTVKSIIYNLMERTKDRGIKIIEIDGAFQMTSNDKYFEYIKSFVESKKKRPLSQSVMETLAIIAYKQPVTKPQIEEIKGVDATHAVNKLMEMGLVCEKGRAETPGKPILFGTTTAFLKYFGYKSLRSLPQTETT